MKNTSFHLFLHHLTVSGAKERFNQWPLLTESGIAAMMKRRPSAGPAAVETHEEDIPQSQEIPETQDGEATHVQEEVPQTQDAEDDEHEEAAEDDIENAGADNDEELDQNDADDDANLAKGKQKTQRIA